MVGIYPGSFDPFTVGHLDVLKNAALLFDKVYVAVLYNAEKRATFSVKDRLEMIERVIKQEGLTNVQAGTFDGLVVQYAGCVGAQFIIRGLRATSDFEYEFQIDAINRHLDGDIKTVYFMASPAHSFLSSSNVKEIGYYGGNIEGLVPQYNLKSICERLTRQ